MHPLWKLYRRMQVRCDSVCLLQFQIEHQNYASLVEFGPLDNNRKHRITLLSIAQTKGMEKDMASVLVLGATGATGRLVVQQLLERGNEVHAVARSRDRLPAGVRDHVLCASILKGQ